MAQQGLFDTRSQEQILNDRWREQHGGRMEQINAQRYHGAGEQTAAQVGGLMASAIGKRFAPPTLTPEEQVRTSAIQTATQRTKVWRTQHPDASVEDIGLETQRHLAEELIKAGDMQGVQIAQAYAEQAKARQLADAQIAKLEADANYVDANIRQMNWDYEQGKLLAGKNRIVQAWNAGAQFGEGGMAGFINDDGDLLVKDETGQERVIPRGQFFIHPPSRGFKDYTLGDLSIRDSEAGEFRDTAGAVMKEASDAIEMSKILEEGAIQDGQINWLAETGQVQSFFTKWMDNVTGTMRALDPEGSYNVNGVNMEDPAARQAWLERNPSTAAAIDTTMPAHIRSNTVFSQRWRAAITRAAYASARAEEPGARNVTDNDFSNAVIAMAGYTSDPEAFRRVTLDRVNSHIQAFEDRRIMYEPDVQRKMISPAGYARYEQRIKDFKDRYANNYGRASSPGEGLTSPSNRVLQYNPETGLVE